MESLVEGDLVGLLQAQGIAVERTCTNVKGGRDGRHYEFDILAHLNGEEVVVVEVKTTLRAEDVTEFLGKLENSRITSGSTKGSRYWERWRT